MSTAAATQNALFEARDHMVPLDDARLQAEHIAATEDFLLSAWPLIELARGDKRRHMRESWARLAVVSSRRRLRERVPSPMGPRGVALALHTAVLHLCRAYGLTGVDLTEAYNAFAENMPNRRDEIAAIKALLALIIAEELVAR